MHYFQLGSMLSLILLLAGCHQKPDAEPNLNSSTTHASEAAVDPKLEALLNTPVSDADENTIAEFLAAQEETPVLNEELEQHSTALPDEVFELQVYREETQSTTTGYIDKINILSLNDAPTQIRNVQVNRGNCRVISLYDHQNMRYGSVALAYPRCNAAHIREVSISTDSGTYTYNFS